MANFNRAFTQLFKRKSKTTYMVVLIQLITSIVITVIAFFWGGMPHRSGLFFSLLVGMFSCTWFYSRTNLFDYYQLAE